MNLPTNKPVFAIDAGDTLSGFAILEHKSKLLRIPGMKTFGKVPNEEILELIKMWHGRCDFAIEFPYPKNNTVPFEVFAMTAWVGRMEQVILDLGSTSTRIFRHRQKSVMCRSGAATDAMIRASVIDLLGGKGTKSNPGPTFGVTADVWQAIAVGITHIVEGDSMVQMKSRPVKPTPTKNPLP